MADSAAIFFRRTMRMLAMHVTWLGFGMVIAPAAPAIAQDDARTSAIKAAFIYNFAKFTAWPDEERQRKIPVVSPPPAMQDNTVSSDATPELRFCFYRGSLEWAAVETLAGKSVNERRVQVLEFSENQPRCDVVYIGAVAGAETAQRLIERNRGQPTLLVSDLDGFARNGGDIELYTTGARLRFKVNLATVTGRRLKLSSKVLQLAEIVGKAE